tara:strand:- start:1204 stop:1416 length:213 start_codon:yes stop_codon:yes gene_type:complete
MCISSAKAAPVVTRPDPNVKYVDGNVFDPKASPPEIDNTPVVSDKKKKSSVSQSSDVTTSQSSDLTIPTY